MHCLRMRLRVAWVLAWWVCVVAGLQRETHTLPDFEVTVTQGRISGQIEKTQDGKAFYSYRSIPFAQPPVGELRFKDPVAADEWEGVRDGSQYSQPCLQPSYRLYLLDKEEVIGSEDCLYLNVFTPFKGGVVEEAGGSVSVMVYIHGGSYGGGFLAGSVKDYNPAPLLSRNVIVVTIQYRLGLLGFVSTEDETLPGNLGLKDQTLALRWVKENIDRFGGDPKKVTVFGEGAGAASVHMQILSPYAEDLFQRAILQSGSALSPLAIHDKHRELAFQLARLWNCSAQDSKQVFECLNTAPLRDLALAPHRMATWNLSPNMASPRVDGDFLPDHPAQLLKAGLFNMVDIITGVNEHEGAPTTLGFVSHRKTDYAILKFNFSSVGPLSLMMLGERETMFLTRRAYLQYTSISSLMEGNGEDVLDSLTQLYGDRWVRSGVEDTVHLHTLAGTRVYLYQLHHRGQLSMANFLDTSRGGHYVCHGDEVFYFFDDLLTNQRITRHEDHHVRQIMTTLWTNFATNGDPTINGSLGFRWSRVDIHNTTTMPTLQISTNPTMTLAHTQRTNFWRNLPTKMNKIFYPERFL